MTDSRPITPTIERHVTGGVTLTFPASDTVFATRSAAEAYLEERGFSVGRRQASSPCGILYGAYDIMKWRNLSAADIAALHGRMTGDGRHGPIEIVIDASAPLAAQRAICAPQRTASPKASGRGLDRSVDAASIAFVVVAVTAALWFSGPIATSPKQCEPKFALRADPFSIRGTIDPHALRAKRDHMMAEASNAEARP